MKGFIEFIRERGVVGLALGFIMGSSLTKLVTSLVNSIINPLVGVLMGKTGNLTKLVINLGSAKIHVGDFISALIDFVIIAFIVYLIFRRLGLEKLDKKKEDNKK